jgi:ABC-type glycerol-3-phosphate transport system substrate-binding protein
MKKILSITLAIAMILSLATACSTPAAAPATTQPQSSEESNTPDIVEKPADLKWDGFEDSIGLTGTITYMHWGDDYERQMYADLIAAYQELVPGVKIE